MSAPDPLDASVQEVSLVFARTGRTALLQLQAMGLDGAIAAEIVSRSLLSAALSIRASVCFETGEPLTFDALRAAFDRYAAAPRRPVAAETGEAVTAH